MALIGLTFLGIAFPQLIKAWQATSLQLTWSSLQIGPEASEDGLSFQPPSSVAECPAASITLGGSEAATLIWQDGTLAWPQSTAERITFLLESDCSVPSILVAERVDEELGLPWGSSDIGTLATGGKHLIPIEPGTATAVTWWKGSHGETVSLRLEPAPENVLTEVFPTPFLSAWWQTQPGVLSEGLDDCHFGSSLWWPRQFEPCYSATQSVFWERRGQTLPSDSHEPNTAAAPQPGDVMISEVNWAGSFRGNTNLASDEWIEISNITPEPLELQGSAIRGAKAGGGTLRLEQSVVIAPFGQVVISRLPTEESQLAHQADLVIAQLSLSNTEAALLLISPTGQQLDRTPSGPWQRGSNDLSPQLRTSAQRHFAAPLLSSSWDGWFDCSDSTDTWCQELARRSHKPGTTATFSTPGQASPW